MTLMKEQLIECLKAAAETVGAMPATVSLEYPENSEHGDFSTNIALASAKKLKTSPKALAEKIVTELKGKMPSFVDSVSIAGAGFINIKAKDSSLTEQAIKPVTRIEAAPKRKVMVEYTDPNTFKAFHIGHIMSNTIGESLSRLIERSGAKVVRVCYPSDIGLHIAKSLWALRKHLSEMPTETAPIQEKTAFLGKMYVEGTNTYDADPHAKAEIDALNKVIYEKSDEALNKLYEKGRKWSLDHFEMLYKVLGTSFDDYIYESEMAPVGLDVVRAHEEDIFERSDGAVVFKGEEFGLHTRVFINSQGLPTYEAKDLGLNVTKFKKHPDAAESVIITASEQNAYFKVLKQVLLLIDKENGAKTTHIGHGMMRFASGKMSSRTGNVVTAEALLSDIKGLVRERIAERGFNAQESEEISEAVAVGAIKYTILRSSIGSDIVFDSASSISFEGDSGPYLQYSAVRAQSVLAKAGELGSAGPKIVFPEKAGMLERLIIRFPDIAERARQEYAPQHVANYLINLAGAFNGFYAGNTIVDPKEPMSPYRIELTKAFLRTMTDGLWLLGIKVPKKM
jgi:arginyl-tRNA synthetase